MVRQSNINHFVRLIIGIVFLCLLMVFVSTLGSADIPFKTAIKIMLSRLPLIGNMVDLSNVEETSIVIITKIRLPRIILSAIIGSALASSGVAFQGIFKNPMADPYVLGISSGAALGASLMIVIGGAFQFLGLSHVSLGAYAGAIGTTFLVYNLSRVGKKTPTMSLLLTGIAVSFFLSSMVSLIMALNRDQIEKIMFWTMGSVAAASWDKVLMVLVPTVIGIIIFISYSRDLNLMLTGEDSAQSLGVEVERVKTILLVAGSIVTASAVATSGIIGFVGLVVPHAVRLVTGPDHKKLIPFTLIFGSIFLVIADTLSRTIVAPAEIPIGVFTALCGAPYFLFLLHRRKRELLKG